MTAASQAPRTDTTLAQQVRSVIVVGGGQMGSGIAQVFASAGRKVAVSDLDEGVLARARTAIESSSSRLHAKGVLSDEQRAWCADNISYTTSLAEAATDEVDLAIEAISEDAAAKQAVFSTLDERLRSDAILASNTSSISITQLAASTQRPGRVVGMHFMNPPPMLELVEVIAGIDTEQGVVDLTVELARDLGKTPVLSTDSPGFITNRVLMPLINEAFFCLHEGVGSADDIDAAMKLGMRHPMGPLALADLIGLDTCLAIMNVLQEQIGDDKYRPSPLLRNYVAAGRLGRKAGRGVYEYSDGR